MRRPQLADTLEKISNGGAAALYDDGQLLDDLIADLQDIGKWKSCKCDAKYNFGKGSGKKISLILMFIDNIDIHSKIYTYFSAIYIMDIHSLMFSTLSLANLKFDWTGG